MNGNRKDLTGQRFGRLVVIEPVTTGEYHNSVWLCQCDCGNKKIVPTYRLLNGRTYSCGCYRKQAKQVIEELAKVKTENERLKKDIKEIGERMTFLNTDRCRQIMEIMVYELSLKEIRGIVSEPCIESEEDCNSCNSNCMNKDILKIINEVLKDE